MKHNTFCHICSNSFYRRPSHKSRSLYYFCSLKCSGEFKSNKNKKEVKCLKCNLIFYIKKGLKNKFCSQSCAAKYNSKFKTKGFRRSKLEIWLEQELTILYPNLEIHYNKKNTINSELDIYIPSLKLAFELNGIFHYEPIFGDNKLNQIKNNDINKFQECQKLGISLCVIDTSSQKYFKVQTSKKYLDIIVSLITVR